MLHENYNLDRFVQDLDAGKVLLMPTDTVWGVVCDALQPEAIRRVYEMKGLPMNSGLVTIVSSLPMLLDYAPNMHPRLETLMSFHTRTLTFLYDDVILLPQELQGPDQTTAIRITFDPILKRIIEQRNRPLVASIASTSKTGFPKHFGEISSDILTKVDSIMKYRQDDKRPSMPSVIARFGAEDELEFIRE